MSLNELLNVSKATVNELHKGETFILKDLFRGFEWERIPKGDRTKLGSSFSNFVENEGSNLIICIGKTPQNQLKYQKL